MRVSEIRVKRIRVNQGLGVTTFHFMETIGRFVDIERDRHIFFYCD